MEVGQQNSRKLENKRRKSYGRGEGRREEIQPSFLRKIVVGDGEPHQEEENLLLDSIHYLKRVPFHYNVSKSEISIKSFTAWRVPMASTATGYRVLLFYKLLTAATSRFQSLTIAPRP
jgi:hypothetical protein